MENRRYGNALRGLQHVPELFNANDTAIGRPPHEPACALRRVIGARHPCASLARLDRCPRPFDGGTDAPVQEQAQADSEDDDRQGRGQRGLFDPEPSLEREPHRQDHEDMSDVDRIAQVADRAVPSVFLLEDEQDGKRGDEQTDQDDRTRVPVGHQKMGGTDQEDHGGHDRRAFSGDRAAGHQVRHPYPVR